MERLRIAAVKYHNTLPMLRGLQEFGPESIDVILGDPAACARALFDRTVDIALCPVGALLGRSDYRIVSRFAIGTRGAVRTVKIYSHRPITELKKIVLSSESRTSNVLVRVLDHYSWKQAMEFLPPDSTLDDESGQLCIGDECFRMEDEFPYATDLGLEWVRYSGLPMVFACWVARDEIPGDLIDQFNAALAKGIAGIPQMTLPEIDRDIGLRKYLQENIAFELDAKMRSGLQYFIDRADNLPLSLEDVSKSTSRQPSKSEN